MTGVQTCALPIYDFVFNHQVFIDKKPAYYEFKNNTENMTEAEVFEKYAKPS